ncbi:hypothetical protein [Neisseria weixii]|uniref:hypothetical protein n=1 Tax=Neisseria weixii TaxID=1853276 RepID=UPI0018F690CE|nr:hypothetical protein [Neisseria weixii]
MGKPFVGTIKKSHAEDIDNSSNNPAFSQIMDARLSRRRVLQSFGALGVTSMLPLSLMSKEAQAATEATRFQPVPRFARATALGFKSVQRQGDCTGRLHRASFVPLGRQHRYCR